MGRLQPDLGGSHTIHDQAARGSTSLVCPHATGGIGQQGLLERVTRRPLV